MLDPLRHALIAGWMYKSRADWLNSSCRLCMTKLECGTPRAIVSRWLASLKGGKGLESGNERSGNRRRKKVEYGGCEELRVKCSTKCLNEELVTELNGSCECGRPAVEGAGRSKNDATFNLGAGFGLAFLIASSKTELNKMMELREQMESLVQSAKDDLQGVDQISKSSRARKTVDYSTTEAEESMNSNGYFSHTDYTPSESRVPLKFQDQDLQHGRSKQVWSHLDRKDMEIELESELKHLQLLCESEEHQDPSQFSIQEHDGIPPEELALRLHEVVESRLEERIKELEAALKQALQKLDEKETEASWWKETAQLFSVRLPEAPNASSLRQKSVLPAAPQCSKRRIKLVEKLSSEILMNP